MKVRITKDEKSSKLAIEVDLIPRRESPPPLPDGGCVLINLRDKNGNPVEKVFVKVEIINSEDEIILDYYDEVKNGDLLPIFITPLTDQYVKITAFPSEQKSLIVTEEEFWTSISKGKPYVKSQVFIIKTKEEGKKEPNLLPSPELNRNEYYPGDDVIIKMQIMNKGNGDATNVKLTMTLPLDIEYVKADILRGVLFADRVEFNINKIKAGETFTFHIFCKVKKSVQYEKRADIIFDVTCKEGSTDRKAVHLLIKSKRGEVMPLSISVYLKNIKTDPDTGEGYIDFDTPLELSLKVNGGTAPYTLKIDWGDGSSKEEKKVEGEETLNFKHKFQSRGSIEIKFEVIDSVGRSKKASARLKVK